MHKASPKFSIIIPVRNGAKYLPSCLESICGQSYEDYELIISDDHSEDGTKEYLQTLTHPNIKIIEPPESLSMTEHWEWALSHAQGEWLIFVGQDDGVQPYFFELADQLTKIAEHKKLRTITSQRAYYFWPGCEMTYGDNAVFYVATNRVEIRNFHYEAFKALMGIQTYFELPQMYTTSFFQKDLLDEARIKQDGKVFTCHPQDANLGAIASSLEKQYLFSAIPLGWVGTSPKSAGMAISCNREDEKTEDAQTLKNLKAEYLEKISKSKLDYHELAGSFAFGNNAIYFWQALLKTEVLRHYLINMLLMSKLFRILLFGAVWLKIGNVQNEEKKEIFAEILDKNRCSFLSIKVSSVAIRGIRYLWQISYFFYRGYRKIRRWMHCWPKQIKYRVAWSQKEDIDMHKASVLIQSLIKKEQWISHLQDLK